MFCTYIYYIIYVWNSLKNILNLKSSHKVGLFYSFIKFYINVFINFYKVINVRL